MTNELPPYETAKLRELMEQNLQYSKEILKLAEKNNRYIFWARVASFIKIVLIIVPLILAYIYLLPYFRQAISTYQELFGLLPQTSNQAPPSSANLLQELQRLQKSGDWKNLEQLLK